MAETIIRLKYEMKPKILSFGLKHNLFKLNEAGNLLIRYGLALEYLLEKGIINKNEIKQFL